MTLIIPKKIEETIKLLHKNGYEGYIVGGCVRDLIIGRKPRDWDITTNAPPDEIISLFPKTFYNNKYGTVTIVDEKTGDSTLQNIEITPYRIESKYTDKRHPDKIEFSNNLLDDLSRRDFTINSIAYDPIKDEIIDPYKGQKSIKDTIIKTVGDPMKRFSEDALRLIRAVRISTELSFTLDIDTSVAIKENSMLIKDISVERVRDEFTKIVLSDNPKKGIELLHKLTLLKFILPELENGIGVEQNEAHSYDVWEHILRTLQHAAKRKWSFHVRLGALFHDIAKPETRRWSKEKNNWTFYGHDVVGSRVTKKVMSRLKYPKEDIVIVSKLVRYHLFFSDVDKITMSAVRRLVKNVGKEDIWELMNVRACDRIGTGRPKEQPYRLRKFESMIEEALRDPISVGMLNIDGKKIMEVTREKSGPKIGLILHALLEDILEDPQKNTLEYLSVKTIKLNKISIEKLKFIAEKGKQKSTEIEKGEVQQIRKRYWVK